MAIVVRKETDYHKQKRFMKDAKIVVSKPFPIDKIDKHRFIIDHLLSNGYTVGLVRKESSDHCTHCIVRNAEVKIQRYLMSMVYFKKE